MFLISSKYIADFDPAVRAIECVGLTIPIANCCACYDYCPASDTGEWVPDCHFRNPVRRRDQLGPPVSPDCAYRIAALTFGVEP